MPFLHVQTSARFPDLQAALRAASARVAALTGKDERWVMVRIEEGCAMTHVGSPQPAAFVTLATVGLPGDRGPLIAGVCELLGELAGVPSERIYVRLEDLDPAAFGWKGELLA